MASSSYNPATAKADGGREATSEAAAVVVPMLHKESDELYRGLKKAKKDRGCTAKERISKMPPCTAGKRSSIYRGVTRHRWTGRYEAHLWDKSTWNQNQNKKGKQVYLGAYDDEEAAARAYDLAALRYWGPGTLINFPVTDYKRDLEEMQNMSREEYLALLRRKSSGFSRGISKYRPLSSSRWDPYIGCASGADHNKRISYGDNATSENDYIGGSLCIDRKIDLTNYIKWWGTNKQGQVDSHNKPSHDINQCRNEDIGNESKTGTWSNHPTEPYEMPSLGMSLEGKKRKGSSSSSSSSSSTSDLSILLRSAAYKSLQEKGLKRKAIDENDDDSKDRNVIHKMDHGKGVENSSYHVQTRDMDLTMLEDYPFKQMLFFHPFPPSPFDGAF